MIKFDKYVFFCNSADYYSIIYSDIIDKPNVLFYNKPGIEKCKKLNKLEKLHTAKRINNIINLPLKSIWYPMYYDKHLLSNEESICFIFYESNRHSYDKDFLNYLKWSYPRSKHVFVFTNPVSTSMAYPFLTYIQTNFNLILSDDLGDVKRYGFIYSEDSYSILDVKPCEELASDIFFIGNAKDRLDLLLNLFKAFEENGIKTKFFITGVNDDKKYENQITYNMPLPYTKVLQYIASTNCLLEILQKNQIGLTLRTQEAISYNKKLLTNNQTITSTKYYNDSFIKTFTEDTIKQLNYPWIKLKEPVHYDLFEPFSPYHFLDIIERNL